MSNRKKRCNTYIVTTRKTINGTTSITTGRYAVGAKNEKEAMKIAREKIGKFNKFNVYFKSDDNFLNYKEVSKEEFNEGEGKWIHNLL